MQIIETMQLKNNLSLRWYILEHVPYPAPKFQSELRQNEIK